MRKMTLATLAVVTLIGTFTTPPQRANPGGLPPVPFSDLVKGDEESELSRVAIRRRDHALGTGRFVLMIRTPTREGYLES